MGKNAWRRDSANARGSFGFTYPAAARGMYRFFETFPVFFPYRYQVVAGRRCRKVFLERADRVWPHASADECGGSLESGHHAIVAAAQAPYDAPGHGVRKEGQGLVVAPHDEDELAGRLETFRQFPAVQ